MPARPTTQLTADATKSTLDALRDAGLTTYEAQAYLTLIRNQNVSATQLCNATRIPDSKIYFALEELQRKGLVVVIEGVPRHYTALHPKEALRKLKSQITGEYEARIERLDQLTISLEPLYDRVERTDIELAYVLKGFDNVLGRMIEALKSARREVVVFIPDTSIYDRLASQLTSLHRNGVKVKLAVHPKVRKQVGSSSFTEVRELSPQCQSSWLVIIDGKTAISSSEWKTERCHAILTQDPLLVNMSREYFENPRCCLI